MRAAVFLDRDGTLNREVEGALARLEQLELLAGAAQAAARLAHAGFTLVVLTNQSAVARGWTDLDAVRAVNRELTRQLALAGAPLAGIYVCPHHPTSGEVPYRRPCTCRKPGPGLLRRAAHELDLDLAASWIVGDAARDLAAGAQLGVRGVLVATGKGQAEHARLPAEQRTRTLLAADLAEAAEWILQAAGAPQGR